VSSAARAGEGGVGLEEGCGDGRQVVAPQDGEPPDPSELAGFFLRPSQLGGSDGAAGQAPGGGPELDDGDTDDILKLIADMGGGGHPSWNLTGD